MGLYLDFHFKATLVKDTPIDVIELISGAIILDDDIINLPDHPFFKTERWSRIFVHHSDMPPPLFYQKLNKYYIIELHCCINYGFDEMQEFLNWIRPWICGRRKKEFIGWWKQEGMDMRVNEYKNPAL